VDLARYAGRWYEIARLPMPFQRAEDTAVAEYGANADGTISVHNIATRPDGTPASNCAVLVSCNCRLRP
jgi:apolipoprotein D and lipocalin family protein